MRKIVMPWEVCTSPYTKTSSPKDAELYISHSPVSGLYARTRKNERYLVALKTYSKPDAEHIFVRNKIQEQASRREREQAKELGKRLQELGQGFAPSNNEVYVK